MLTLQESVIRVVKKARNSLATLKAKLLPFSGDQRGGGIFRRGRKMAINLTAFQLSKHLFTKRTEGGFICKV